ncbi:sensor histidine kinase [Pontibacter cellulosilyticus]|uniref:Histidine kinase n=1 Tax=Pontibacter cellulosilyticus TaxID=1720253 RepID=A0A923N489_9BACT|nr:histidine kinase [Pontibacter cellulosilyticus]MBC5992233.1 histidine kinase [Pontibacter cellulosilyticus]
MSRKYRNIAVHAAAWLLFLLYEWIFKQGILNNPETSVFHLKIVVIRVLMLIPAVYFTLYFLVPRLFLQGRKTMFTLALIGTIAVDTLLMKTLNYFLVLEGVEGFAGSYLESISGLTGWLIFMGNIAFNISFAMMFYFINKWVHDDKKRQQLEAAKKEAELSLLKSQVQPHFLFNTINNIYALSQKGSPYTTEMIYRLSGLLEYMLYDSNREWTPLKREISYIRNYLEIEKIRYGDRLDVSFALYGDVEGLAVPPLVLLPFVENSFKHGLSQHTGTCWLRIEISYKAPWLLLKVENSKPDEGAEEVKKGGLGITNVLKRLDILLDGAYELKQLDSPDSYLVTLKLTPAQKELTHEEPTRPLEVLDRRR